MLKSISFISLKRLYSVQNSIKTKICIVGSGPAGFYAAQHLSKKLSQCEIDIYERLPVPFGLVRYGVAPDHPDVKNVISTFTKTANSSNVRFVGNVNLGTDVSLADLRQAYHIVLLTYGADENRSLGIPGENLKNVIPAKKIVGWYNGLPWDKDLKIDLNGEVAAIFGQGNVAVDVARILLTPIDELKKTDITQYALDQIAQSKLKKVYLIGRRGPIQAAFTIKELREMLKLRDCSTVWNKNDFQGVTDHIPKLSRPKKRITELMLSSAEKQPTAVPENTKIFKPVFLRSPLEILGNETVEKVTLGVNKLEGDDVLRQKAVLTDRRETMDCDLVVTSIGYKSVPADPSLPFDTSRGVVKNVNSKVDNGLYVSGWLGTGPTGVIVSTMSNAFTVADTIIKDLEKDHINQDKAGYEDIKKILDNKNVQIVGWRGWEKIDEFEIKEGEKLGKPREKVVDINEMLKIASQ